MVKAKSENNTNNSGTMLTAADGTQYFVMGKIRIKVSEHGEDPEVSPGKIG